MQRDPAVEELQAAAYTVPTDAPEGDGTFAWGSTTLVLVKVRADGLTGFGWTYGPAACQNLATGLLSPVVVGLPALDVGRATGAMARAARNAPLPGTASYAISAVDCALWDLKARLLGLPLHRLLGAVRNDVAVYGSGGFTTYRRTQLTDQLTGWVHGQGIPRVKIKIGESFGTSEDRDVARMQQAREIIGPETALFVDANGAYTAKQAIRVMQRVQDLKIGWLEEPVPSDDFAGLREVRRRVDADVAAGEYGTDLAYYRELCRPRSLSSGIRSQSTVYAGRSRGPSASNRPATKPTASSSRLNAPQAAAASPAKHWSRIHA